MVGRGWFILLGLVLVLFAVTIAVPVGEQHPGGVSNETLAIATLRNLGAAQIEFTRRVAADRDGDGHGEFGSFLQLAGVGTAPPLDPPILSRAYRRPLADGRLSRSGYYFRIFLATNTGMGFSGDDRREGSGSPRPGPVAGERYWCCYAWPVTCGESGERTFFVNQAGDILATQTDAYDGDRGPAPGAAFTEFGRDRIVGRIAVDGPGQDGNTWRKVN